jgi:hypothetical protein
MRKIILIGIATFIFVSAAALSIIWFSRAAAVKKDTEAFLASLSTPNGKFTYEKVEVSGFPTSMNIAIFKPNFSGRVDKLFQDLNLNKTLKIPALPEWNEDYTLNGNITVKVNALSNKYKLEVNGEYSGKGNVAGKPIMLTSQSEGSSSCELQLKNTNGIFGNLWNIHSLTKNSDKLFQDFRSLDCVHSAGKLLNSETKEAMASYGESRIFISRTPENNLSNIRLYVQIKDTEVQKSYDDVYIAYQGMFAPQKKFVLPSYYGKQNIELDITYNGTEDWKNPEAKNLPLEIRIDKLSMSNAAYNSDTSFKLTNALKDNVRNASLSYKTESAATELLRTMLKTQLGGLADSILSNEIPSSPAVKEKLASLPTGELDRLINSVVPDFVSLGKTVSGLSVDYSGDGSFTEGQINLTDFEISVAPYGITATGSTKRSKGEGSRTISSGNISLSCRNCPSLIDDVVVYINHVKDVMAIFSPTSVAFNISPENVKSFKNFLLAFEPTEESGDKNIFKFNITSDGKGGITVNKQDSLHVLKIINEFAPQFTQPTHGNAAPVAPQPTPAAVRAVPSPVPTPAKKQ